MITIELTDNEFELINTLMCEVNVDHLHDTDLADLMRLHTKLDTFTDVNGLLKA